MKHSDKERGCKRRRKLQLGPRGGRQPDWRPRGADGRGTRTQLSFSKTHHTQRRKEKKQGQKRKEGGDKRARDANSGSRDTLFCSTEDDDGGRRQRSTATMASDDRWLCRREFIRGDRRCRLVVAVSVVDRACAVDTNSMEDGGFRRHRRAN